MEIQAVISGFVITRIVVCLLRTAICNGIPEFFDFTATGFQITITDVQKGFHIDFHRAAGIRFITISGDKQVKLFFKRMNDPDEVL